MDFLGIDVRKSELHACLLQGDRSTAKSVRNSSTGIAQSQTWLKNRKAEPIHVCLETIVVRNTRTSERRAYETNALFILIGADAETDAISPEILRDARGYICTGRDVLDLETEAQRHWPLERDPCLLETSVPGVFAAGDVRQSSIKRVASGVGGG